MGDKQLYKLTSITCRMGIVLAIGNENTFFIFSSFFILTTEGLSYYVHDISKNHPYPACSSEGRLISLARHRRLTKYTIPPAAAIARVVVATTTPAAKDRSSPVTTSATNKSSFIFYS